MYSPYIVHIGFSCCGCGACAQRCVRGNLELAGELAELKKDYVCVGCMACVKWCPTHALAVEPAKSVSTYLRAR